MKKVFLCFAGVHLLVIFILNIYGTLEGWHAYYNGKDAEKSLALKASENLSFSTPVWLYGSYTGSNTTYGFYAPNVASQFLTAFFVYDSLQSQIGVKMHPDFRQKESRHRFALCTSLMMERMGKAEPNKVLDNYLEVIMHQVSMHIKEGFPDAAYVTAKLYVHEFPTIDDFVAGKREAMIEVDEYFF